MQEVACDKPANFDQDDNLIFQSYFTFCLLAQLMRDRTFVQSQYFKELQFDAPIAKEVIERHGVDNQGCLLICLYALLVIPKEKLEGNYKDLFETINTQIASYRIRCGDKLQRIYEQGQFNFRPPDIA